MSRFDDPPVSGGCISPDQCSHRSTMPYLDTWSLWSGSRNRTFEISVVCLFLLHGLSDSRPLCTSLKPQTGKDPPIGMQERLQWGSHFLPHCSTASGMLRNQGARFPLHSLRWHCFLCITMTHLCEIVFSLGCRACNERRGRGDEVNRICRCGPAQNGVRVLGGKPPFLQYDKQRKDGRKH